MLGLAKLRGHGELVGTRLSVYLVSISTILLLPGFYRSVRGRCIFCSASDPGNLTSLPCIDLGMFHCCKNSTVSFGFLCMPFIWHSQCAVQMLSCQTPVPSNLLCDPWLVLVPLGTFTLFPVTRHT